MLRFLVRRTLRSIVTVGLILLTLPWLFLHQLAQESQADDFLIVPRPLPTLFAEQDEANQAVLGYRACPSGPTIQRLVDSSLFGGPIGTVHLRAGSRVSQRTQDSSEYQVDIVLEHHYADPSTGRRDFHEHIIGFAYNRETDLVIGRDQSGGRYLESARWECVREQSPFRRGPPEPVD
jgi:hypothetical protein